MDTSALENSTRTDNHSSPFGEAGLLGDPLAYLLGKKYKKFMRKTFEIPNQVLSPAIKKFDKFDRKINPLHRAIDKTEIGGKIKDFVHEKPADSAGAILGSVFGGGALLGGMGGGGAAGGGAAAPAAGSGGASGSLGGLGGWGGGTQGGLGVFANGGQAGMAGVGGGNAGGLAASGGISGGAGIGSATEGGAAANWQELAKQGASQQQQQEQKKQTPYVGRAAEVERARVAAEQADLQKKQMMAASLRAQGMYSPA